MSIFESKLQARVVRNMVLGSDRFYRPTKKKLRLFTSTGREILYPYHVLVNHGIIMKPRRKSFLFSKASLRSRNRSSLSGIEEDDSDFSRLKTTCDNFIFGEKWAYFEKWPIPQIYASNLSGKKKLLAFSMSFNEPDYFEDPFSNPNSSSISLSRSTTVSWWLIVLNCLFLFYALCD